MTCGHTAFKFIYRFIIWQTNTAVPVIIFFTVLIFDCLPLVLQPTSALSVYPLRPHAMRIALCS